MATRPHFLLASVAAQGHINPARQLARRLARLSGVRVTVAIPIVAYRRMFKSSSSNENLQEDQEYSEAEAEGLLTYIPFSDGAERGLKGSADMPEIEASVVSSLTRVAEGLAARDRPVTCVIYTLLLWMASEAARNIGVPSVLYWIQPASVFAIYHSYFGGGHGIARVIADHSDDPSFPVELPGLKIPLRIRDLPSFITNPSSEDDPYYFLFELFQGVFRLLGREIASGSRPTVLVNTFRELEADVISSVDNVELLAVGPMVVLSAAAGSGHDLFEHDDRSDYMEWLERQEEKSVVYVSFGSLSSMSRKQMEEIHEALRESKRPYLWVIRKDSSNREVMVEGGCDVDDEEKGMVVEWCDQVRVLSHRSVGCFVTHCGWNSTTESMVCGVPTVMLPQWTDQATNARLVEGSWGVGVHAIAKEGGVVEGEEVKRCLDAVMGLREREIRRNAEMWRDKAREAREEGGSSVVNIRAFVERYT